MSDESIATDLDQRAREEKKQRRPRGTGSVYLQPASANYWIQFYRNGKVYRQSAGTIKKRVAEKLLQKKLAEIQNHTFVEPKHEKITISELADDMLREYEMNERKSIDDAKTRWGKHLKPVFANFRAANVGNDDLVRYAVKRQNEGASNGSINREFACLKRMFSLGVRARKVYLVPTFPHLQERNVRKGFVEGSQYEELAKACAAEGLWLRAMFEVAYNFGWRVSELQNLRVRQIELGARTIRLDPGETKNDQPRVVVMTGLIYALLQQCVVGKQPDAYVFTREDGKRVRDFRVAWWRACIKARLGQMVCPKCEQAVGSKNRCAACSLEWKRKDLKYSGLIFHDLRRTAVRNMVRRGIPERVAMTISGHKTRAVFDRYNIVSESDLKDAAAKLEPQEKPEAEDFSHRTTIVDASTDQIAKATNIH